MTRQEAIKILSNRDGHGIPSGYNSGYAEAIEVAIETLKAEPTKHGAWIIDKSGSLMCSKCGTLLDEAQKPSRYCPNCGAKMDEEVL